jgi:hypothetical protein
MHGCPLSVSAAGYTLTVPTSTFSHDVILRCTNFVQLVDVTTIYSLTPLLSDTLRTQAAQNYGRSISAPNRADTSWGTRASKHSHKVRNEEMATCCVY